MKKFRIFIDLDDVLVDFVGGCCDLFGVKKEDIEAEWTPGEFDIVPPFHRVLCQAAGAKLPKRPEGFWWRIDQKGSTFWEQLQETSWNSELLALVESITPDWWILTSPSRDVSSYTGKVKYLKRFFGADFDRFLITKHKHLFANENSILIDDRDSNIRDFNAAGGNRILFPRLHNSLHDYRYAPMIYVRDMLVRLGVHDALNV